MKLDEIAGDGFLTGLAEIYKWISDNLSADDSWMPQKQIHQFNITTNADGVDVNVHVKLQGIKTLKVNFNEIDGSFSIRGIPRIKLKTLKGCPNRVTGQFNVSNALDKSITNMIGGPTYVGDSYTIDDNPNINSLEGIPTSLRTLSIIDTGITSLIGVSEHFKKLKYLFVSPTQITSGGIGLMLIDGFDMISDDFGLKQPWMKIILKYRNKPELIFECQAELIEAGYADYAQL